MQFSIASLTAWTALLSAATTNALAAPQSKRQAPFEYRSLTLKFNGGPASYTLDVKADGNYYETKNGLSISLIELTSSPDFNIYLFCNYYTNGQKTITSSSNGKVIAVGPPQPILGVSCQPTSAVPGGCLPNYATCSWSSQQSGTFLSCCQSGYCAASKCRPTS